MSGKRWHPDNEIAKEDQLYYPNFPPHGWERWGIGTRIKWLRTHIHEAMTYDELVRSRVCGAVYLRGN